jgi:hypothetical protein
MLANIALQPCTPFDKRLFQPQLTIRIQQIKRHKHDRVRLPQSLRYQFAAKSLLQRRKGERFCGEWIERELRFLH